MLMASKCRSFFVISVYLKSRNFYFVTSFFDISKYALVPYFGVKINISPVLFSGKHGR